MALGKPITLSEINDYSDTNILIKTKTSRYITDAITAFEADINDADPKEPYLFTKAFNYFKDTANEYVFDAKEINRFLVDDTSETDPQSRNLQFDYLMISVGSKPKKSMQGVQTIVIAGCSKNAAGQYVFSKNGHKLRKPATKYPDKKLSKAKAKKFVQCNRKIKMHTRMDANETIKLHRPDLAHIQSELPQKALNYINDAHNIYIFDKEDLNRFLVGGGGSDPVIKFEYIMIIVGSLKNDEPEPNGTTIIKDKGEQTIVIAGCSFDDSTGKYVFSKDGMSLAKQGTEHPPRLYKPSFASGSKLKIIEVTKDLYDKK